VHIIQIISLENMSCVWIFGILTLTCHTDY